MMMSCCRRLLYSAPVFLFFFHVLLISITVFGLIGLEKAKMLRFTWLLFCFYVAAVVASFVQGQIGNLYRSGERLFPLKRKIKKCTLTPTALEDKCIKRFHLGHTSGASEMKANKPGRRLGLDH